MNNDKEFTKREKYKKCKEKPYENLEQYFDASIKFTKTDCKDDVIKDAEGKYKSHRVWLLWASKDEKNWKCLQVAQSKKDFLGEINDVIRFIYEPFEGENKIQYKNSLFYENVCPDIEKTEYCKFIYSKIGSNYTKFRICFLNVDKYLKVTSINLHNNATDAERIIEICKNQYAEAKIAYETLALYWRPYHSGIDGQTISYIVEHDFILKGYN